MVLDRKSFLKSIPKKSETVVIGSDSVICTELSFSEVNKVRESELVNDSKGTFDGYRFIALMMAYSLRDDKNERIFLDEEIDTIMDLPRTEYLKLAETVKRINGMADDEPKNSEGVLTGS